MEHLSMYCLVTRTFDKSLSNFPSQSATEVIMGWVEFYDVFSLHSGSGKNAPVITSLFTCMCIASLIIRVLESLILSTNNAP